MNKHVVQAIEELQRAFPSSEVISTEDSQGGAYVIVEPVQIGAKFLPQTTWMGGHITAHYPYADIYPVFIDANIDDPTAKDLKPQSHLATILHRGPQFRYRGGIIKFKPVPKQQSQNF